MGLGNLAEQLREKFRFGDKDYEDDYLDDEEDDYEEEPKKGKKGLSIVSPFSKKGTVAEEAPAVKYENELVQINPKSIDDMNQVADCLLDGKMVILNTEDCDEVLARRALDFACGVVYALNCNFVQSSARKSNGMVMSAGIYVITPDEINLAGDFAEKYTS